MPLVLSENTCESVGKQKFLYIQTEIYAIYPNRKYKTE